MKKQTFLLLAFILTLAIIPLTGCGGNGSMSVEPNVTPTPKDTTSYYVSWVEHYRDYSDTITKKLIDDTGLRHSLPRRITEIGIAQRDAEIEYLQKYKMTYIRYYDDDIKKGVYEYVVTTYEDITWISCKDFYHWK